jgi:hypothetical protein
MGGRSGSGSHQGAHAGRVNTIRMNASFSRAQRPSPLHSGLVASSLNESAASGADSVEFNRRSSLGREGKGFILETGRLEARRSSSSRGRPAYNYNTFGNEEE